MPAHLMAPGDSPSHSPVPSSIRRRVKHACDSCSSARTKCDGKLPCRHCVEYEITCAYKRSRKRRGRRPYSEQNGTRRRSVSSPVDQPGRANRGGNDERNSFPEVSTLEGAASYSGSMNQSSDQYLPSYTHHISSEGVSFTNPIQNSRSSRASQATTISNQLGYDDDNNSLLVPRELHFPRMNESNDSSSFESYGNSQVENHGGRIFLNTPLVDSVASLTGVQSTSNPYPHSRLLSPTQILQSNLPPNPAFPRSLQPRLPMMSAEPPRANSNLVPMPDPVCKYPVLGHLLPHIKTIISTTDACDLLDLYFTEPSTSLFECASPYVLTRIFRKESFLRRVQPRNTSPALLAAMLWVTAQTSDAKIFKTETFARTRICDQLYRVCTSLLSSADCEKRRSKTSLISTYGGNDSQISHAIARSADANTTTGTAFSDLDGILTYILFGTVISGGDTKRDCIEWWTKAWSEARSLNLNREQEKSPVFLSEGSHGHQFSGQAESSRKAQILAREEAKEERRRIWWLLYIVDRHLALSYNSPLNILDAECQVYQPLEEAVWQDLESFKYEELRRFFGPSTKITGVGLFEYFLPLMAILGDIVDIHHRSCHPRFKGLDVNGAILAVENSLETYETSLRDFENNSNFDLPDNSQSTYISPLNNSDIQNDALPLSVEQARKKTVISYSKHLLHVLYVLLHGNWDPISILDNPDRWVTPVSFVKCAQHAIFAASAVSDILNFDPELSFMPYLFGIYLMHGSFVLLIFADKMEMHASEIVVQACETLIRAHEVCVTTLNTEYQRNFRKVLRSALCHLKGSMVMDIEQHAIRRREFLSLYKWTRDGTGLAV